jgi:hypothetical protein
MGEKHDGWSLPAAKELVKQLYGVATHTPKLYSTLQDWGVAHFPKGVEDQHFDQDYYDYINSDIGRAVSRREKEHKAKFEQVNQRPYNHDDSRAMQAMQLQIEAIEAKVTSTPDLPMAVKKRGPKFQPKKKRRK